MLEVFYILIKFIYKNYKTKRIYEEFNISPNRNDEKNVLWIVNHFQKLSNLKNKYSKKNEFSEKINLKLDNTKIKKNLKLNYKFNYKERFLITYDWYKFFYNNNKQLKNKTYLDLEYFEKIFL